MSCPSNSKVQQILCRNETAFLMRVRSVSIAVAAHSALRQSPESSASCRKTSSPRTTTWFVLASATRSLNSSSLICVMSESGSGPPSRNSERMVSDFVEPKGEAVCVVICDEIPLPLLRWLRRWWLRSWRLRSNRLRCIGRGFHHRCVVTVLQFHGPGMLSSRLVFRCNFAVYGLVAIGGDRDQVHPFSRPSSCESNTRVGILCLSRFVVEEFRGLKVAIHFGDISNVVQRERAVRIE